jgi:hypothetical protein
MDKNHPGVPVFSYVPRLPDLIPYAVAASKNALFVSFLNSKEIYSLPLTASIWQPIGHSKLEKSGPEAAITVCNGTLHCFSWDRKSKVTTANSYMIEKEEWLQTNSIPPIEGSCSIPNALSFDDRYILFASQPQMNMGDLFIVRVIDIDSEQPSWYDILSFSLFNSYSIHQNDTCVFFGPSKEASFYSYSKDDVRKVFTSGNKGIPFCHVQLYPTCPCDGAVCIPWSDTFLAFGGFALENSTNQLWYLNPSQKWTPVGKVHIPQAMLLLAVIENAIFILGGCLRKWPAEHYYQHPYTHSIPTERSVHAKRLVFKS